MPVPLLDRPFDDIDAHQLYTLAGPDGEFLFATKQNLNWATVVKAAVDTLRERYRIAKAPDRAIELKSVAELLLLRHRLNLVRGENYCHIVTLSQAVPSTFDGTPTGS